jgi:gliding motility-associated-like protein
MKRITLVMLLFILSNVGYSQLLSDFETGIPASWAVFNNGLGSNVWTTTNTISTPPTVCQGEFSAFMNARQQIGAGNTSENWMVTDLVTVPANGQLIFSTRSTISGPNNTTYQIRVSTLSQTNTGTFTPVQQWTEEELNVVFNICEDKVVDLTAFQNQQVYIAFVILMNQPTTALTGDRWIVDNVRLVERCLDPTNLTSTVTATTASLSWTGTAAAWEIEVVPLNTPPTGTGTIYNGALPYVVTGLTANTSYSFYVRARCGEGNNSDWVGPVNFTTTIAPVGCGGNFVDPGGPTANYANNLNVNTLICPENPTDLVTVTFTSFATEGCCDFLRIYDGNSAAAPLLGTFSGTNLPPSFTSSTPGGCLFFNFTSDGSVVAAGWIANITCAPAPTCPRPTALVTSSVLSTSLNLAWTNNSTATTFHVLALPCTAPAPTASTTGWIETTNNPYSFTGLNPDTCYRLYVRAVCSESDISDWSAGLNATTQQVPPACGGTFTDTGGSAANYTNNQNITTTICADAPGNLVTINFTSFATEGCCDFLRVYNGPSAASPLIGTYSGTALPPEIVSTLGGCITFVFTSDSSVVAAGWVANITCGPPPTCPKPTQLVTSAVLSSTATLAWTNNSTATTFHVLALPCTAPAPNATTTGWIETTNNPYTFTGLNPDTCYRFYVRAVCAEDDISDWSVGVNATTQQVPPACGGTFTDPGGASANYTNNTNVTTTICADSPTNLVTVTFTAFATEGCCDFLRVYDGPSAASPLLGTYSGTALPPQVTSSTPGGCLTFVFTSDSSVVNTGWIANVTCDPAPTCPRPSGLAASTVLFNQATLAWTDNSGATAWQVLALPCGSPAPTSTASGWVNAPTNPFVLTGLTPATCYTFYVRAVCAENDSSNWSIGVNATTQVAPPECGGNFVDPGGISANYPNSANSTVTICPTNPGEFVTVTFTSFDTEANWDALYVFNGNSTAAPQISSGNGAGNVPGGLPGGFWGTTIPGPFTSTDPSGCLTFNFRSDGSFNRPGWVANVTCESCPKPTAVTVTDTNTTTANLTWTSVAGTTWQVLALPCGSAAPTASSTGWQTATSTTYTYTGLNPLTCYNFYVRAVCADDDSSDWSTPGTGTTLPTCPQPINLTVIGADTNTATLSWTNISTATLFEVVVQPVGSGVPTVAGVITANNPYTATGLSAGFYEFYVRAICSTSDSSAWSGPQTFFILASLPGCAGVDIDLQTNTPGVLNLCPGESCVDLTASFFETGDTTTYDVSSIPFSPPFPFVGGIPTSVNTDDVWSPAIQLPFNFCFFGQNYTQALVGSNGVISFDIQGQVPGGAQVPGGYCAWPFTQTIPNTAFPIKAAIYGPYQDINPNVTTPPAQPSINYQVLGTAPCRVLVVNFSEVAQFSCGVSVGLQTSQIVLYETSNTIEVYVQNRTSCTTWNGGRAVIGIQNQAGTQAHVPPGRNTGTWSASNEAWRFTPAGPSNVTFSWLKDGEFYSNDLSINVCVEETTTMTAQAIYTACGGEQTITTDTILLNVVGTELPVQDDVEVCESEGYTLPALLVGNYFTQPNGQGTQLNAGDVITTPQTIYVFATIQGTNGQCTSENSFEVTTTSQIVPVFNPIAPICVGGTAPALPAVSNNSVTGLWTPATISTATAGTFTYEFTPFGAEVCATPTTIEVTITEPVTPTFTAIPIVCQNAPAPTLPATSIEGISGTWSPATINTSALGDTVYTFTPASGSCAGNGEITVTVIAPVTPTFDPIANLCVGATSPTLPGISTNAISGTWNPATISTASAGTFTFEFTPNSSECAVPTTIQVTVVARPNVDTLQNVTACLGDGGYTLPVLTNGSYFTGQNGSGNALTAGTALTTSQTVYIFAPGTIANCSSETSFVVTIADAQAPIFTDQEECASYVLPSLPIGSAYFTQPNGQGTQLQAGSSITNSQTVYIYTTTAEGCNDESSFFVTINSCEIQKGISPNNDGSNDFFDLTNYNVSKLSIFNRYGLKVYSKNNYSNEWYGQTDKGDELPDGTYYYSIDFADGTNKTGWIYINREHN